MTPPPENVSNGPSTMPTVLPTAGKSLLDCIEDANLTLFLEALIASDLQAYLEANPPEASSQQKNDTVVTVSSTGGGGVARPDNETSSVRTVFGPTNEAIERYLEVNGLSSDVNEVARIDGGTFLDDLLHFHIAEGRFPADTNMTSVDVHTLQGDSFLLRDFDIRFRTGSAMVTEADIMATNGLLHVIDAVLEHPPRQCTDSTSWYKNGDPSKNCEWVAEHVPQRCTVKGFDKSIPRYSCPVACRSTDCGDSVSWYKNGDASKNCAWVSVLPVARCDARGHDKSLAGYACPVACAGVDFTTRRR